MQWWRACGFQQADEGKSTSVGDSTDTFTSTLIMSHTVCCAVIEVAVKLLHYLAMCEIREGVVTLAPEAIFFARALSTYEDVLISDDVTNDTPDSEV